jgi:hypothetical protein
MERLLELCPGVRSPWLLYAGFLKANGKSDEIPKLVQRVEAFFGDCGIAHSIASHIHLMLNALPQAEHHARLLWQMSNANINAALPLIETLIRQERYPEASAFVFTLKDRDPVELPVVRRFLMRKDRTGTIVAALGG